MHLVAVIIVLKINMMMEVNIKIHIPSNLDGGLITVSLHDCKC